MKERKIFSAVAIILALMMITMTACGGAPVENEAQPESSEPVESVSAPEESTPAEDITIRLAWWGGEDRANRTMQIVERYMELNPNVTIQCEAGSWDTFWTELVIQLASGTAPDICQTDYQFCGEIIRLGKPFVNMYDLADKIDTSNMVAVDQVYTGEEGYMFGVPIALNGLAMYTNVEFLDKWGVDKNVNSYTWEELVEIGTRIHSEDPDSYLMYYTWDCLSYMFNDVIKGRTGVSTFNPEDYTINCTEEDVVAFLDFYKNLLDTGTLCPVETLATYYTSTTEQIPAWHEGKIGMCCCFNSNASSAVIPGSEFEIMAVQYPYEEASVDLSNAIVPATLWSINKESAYIDECAAFINYFLNDEEAIQIHGTCRGMPSNTVAAQQLLESGDVLKQVSDTIDLANANHGSAKNTIELNSEVKTVIVDYMYSVGYGQMTSQEAATKLLAELESVISGLATNA